MFKRTKSLVAVVALAATGAVVAAGPASAASSGPAYYLSTSATYSGVCLNNGSVTDVAISIVQYKEVNTKNSSEGDVNYYYFTDYGFNRAYRYVDCLHGNGSPGYVFKYYGADDGKLTRKKTTTQVCYGDSCYPAVTSATSWVRQDWI